MKNHANIPIFIPHLGCPNQCVFCNQRTISGVTNFDLACVDKQIRSALETISCGINTEIAFFGGSFTGIESELMTELLEIAKPYVRDGRVSSIRCSTRPDYITPEILDILKRYSVGTIELGLQSSSDAVLGASKRGHTSDDEYRACNMIIDSGFNLVGQMMIGLPCSTIDDEIATADFIIDSGAKAARIYPTVVFKDTELYKMAKEGTYSPLSLDDAIARSSKVLDMFDKAGIEVIRIGLCAQDNLFDPEKYYAGPNHPALGELVIGELLYNRIRDKLLSSEVYGKKLIIKVPKGMLSKAVGQKRKNSERLIQEFGFTSVDVAEKERLCNYEFEVEFERK